MRRELAAVSALLMMAGALVVALAGVVPEASDGYAYVERFFPEDRVIEVRIDLDPSDFADILANPLEEEYKPAKVTVDGVTLDYVGVRAKGNSSLMQVASSDSNRYSFKVDFDHYIDGQNLFGLTKLNLNNSMSDPSFMREYLSYDLLKEMGVPTPAVGYANVYINGELYGLYVTVEGIEEPFLARTYGMPLGSLYKADQGSTLVYQEGVSDQAPTVRLMLGRDTRERLNHMVKALSTGENLEEYLDVDQILRYFAVNTVLVNQDSYVGNFAHNYYLYEQDGIFTILPWDYNMSFAGFGGTTDLSIDQPTQGIPLESRPLLDSLLGKEVYKERYHAYLEEIITEHFTAKKMAEKISGIADMIRPYVKADPTKFCTMEQLKPVSPLHPSVPKPELPRLKRQNPSSTAQAAVRQLAVEAA